MPEEPRTQFGLMLPIQKSELLAVCMAFAWFFLIMFSYQILRPIRESLVSELESNEKSWLFIAVFGVMIVAVPVYAKFVSLLGRKGLILWLINLFAVTILLFAWWNYSGGGKPMIRCFFVWVGVFNLYATSLVWSVLTDLFSNEQSKRLFGPIASGATMGAIAGSTLAIQAKILGNTNMLLIAAGTLEACLLFAFGLEYATRHWPIQQKSQPIHGGVLDGLREIKQSRYLLQIVLFIALISYFGTTIYSQITDVAKLTIVDQGQRTAFFAKLNLYVQIGVLLAQSLIIGPVMRKWGLSVALTSIPVVAAGCFVVMALNSTLTAIGWVDVISRIVTYGFSVPSREVLFTVVSRDAKYKSKNVIDTVVIRGTDSIASTAFAALKPLTSISTVCWLMLPLTLLWVVNAVWLGREQSRLAEQQKRDS